MSFHWIGLAIFLGSCCSSVKNLMGLGFLLIMIVMGPFYLVQFYGIDAGMARAGTILCFLVPGVAYGRFGWELMEQEGFGDGLHWDNLGEYTTATMYMMIVSGVFYALLAIWLDYVWPMNGMGKAAPVHFFLTPAFWFPPEEEERSLTGEVVVKARELVHTFQVPAPKGAKEKKRTLRAVDGVDLDLRKGVVVALLGHNGAGKTTLIRTLTNQLVPESGTISIGGLPVAEAQKYIGICPQFDVI